MRRLALALLLAAAPAPALTAAPQAGPAASADWSRSIAATPAGGIRMGNPEAPVQVVEFMSLTCGHCATFESAGVPALVRDYVRSGRVSFEVRPHPLDLIAATAALIGSCVAPAQAFAYNHALLVSQEQWLARMNTLTDQQVSEINAAAAPEKRRLIAQHFGLDAVAARHGLTAPEARACLADEAKADRLVATKRAAEQMGVSGTPSFAINGTLAANVHDWAALEPLLKAR